MQIATDELARLCAGGAKGFLLFWIMRRKPYEALSSCETSLASHRINSCKASGRTQFFWVEPITAA